MVHSKGQTHCGQWSVKRRDEVEKGRVLECTKCGGSVVMRNN